MQTTVSYNPITVNGTDGYTVIVTRAGMANRLAGEYIRSLRSPVLTGAIQISILLTYLLT